MSAVTLLRPSKAHIWSRCSASPGRELGFENVSSDAAQWGTACHELGAIMLAFDVPARSFIGQKVAGVAVTAEMAAVAKSYADYVMVLGCDEWAVELELQGTDIPMCAGTADFVGWTEATATLDVVDLKTGYDPVKAEGNEQGIPYLSGAWINYAARGKTPKLFRFTIYQPRLDRIDTWELTADQLIAEVKRLREAAKEVLFAPPVAVPGKVQCKWCLAAPHCKELAAAVRELIAQPVSKDMAVLAQQYEALPMVEHWAKSVGAAAMGALTSGQGLPGYKLVEGRRGPRKWVDEEAVEQMAEASAAPVFERSLMSPAKVEKLAPEVWDAFAGYVTQSPGKPAIAPADDKRSGINPADDFED